MLKTATTVFVLATVAVPCRASSQPPPDAADADLQRRMVERIQEVQALDGPNSEDLIEPLTALSRFYHESGDHGLAAATVERARQAVRANLGLSSFDQAPLIQLSIDIEEARGDAAAVWDLEQELLHLARQHPDDLRTVPILRGMGDKRMDLLRRYIAGEFPPQILLGCFYRLPEHRLGSCHAGSKRAAVRSILLDAHQSYMDAIDVIRDQELYSSDALEELETKVARSTYLYGPPRTVDSAYELGRASLQRRLEDEIAESAPLLRRVNALVRIADWDLVYLRYGEALEGYERALAELEQEGAARAVIEQIFLPEIPVAIPTFLPNPLAPDETRASAGHIDVAFEITRFGKSRQIEVVEAANAADADTGRLVRSIKRLRFRPRLVDGQLAATSPILVRYHLSE